MNPLRKLLAVTIALGAAVLAVAPAAAQGWNDDGWRERQDRGYDQGPYRREGYRHYGYEDDGVDTGITDIAICPPGYHLGRTPGLCWPNRH